MKVARALFVAHYRIPHTCLSLQFDHYIQGIDETYIFTNCENTDDNPFLDRVLSKYLDTSQYKYVFDGEMDSLYPSVRNWWIPGDYRNSWLYQQALKLASLDYIDADVILIQDPDTFCINPYNLWEGDLLKYFILPNETHSPAYYQTLVNALGIERQVPHSFVTEFMPVYKEDWLSLKHALIERNNCDPFDAIINNVPEDPDSVPTPNIKWFSEYELLGNWIMTQRDVALMEQKRYTYTHIDNIADCSADEYNCICDACPNLEDSIVFDNNEEVITNFDEVFEKVKKFL